MRRRDLLLGAAASLVPFPALAAPQSFSPDLWPPLTDREAYIAWMVANRGEDEKFVGRRFDRYKVLLQFNDLWSNEDKRAFLLTPREEFCLPEHRQRLCRALSRHRLRRDDHPPAHVGRMTSAIDVKIGDKVLEVGTGSGYQSALLANLTDKVFTIEIITAGRPHARHLRPADRAGYTEYRRSGPGTTTAITAGQRPAPFDKIIVTCGIDHIPPPLLQQLKPNGIMVIPVGPPGAQHILKVVKKHGRRRHHVTVDRSDIFGGKIIPFVPLTGDHQPKA